MGYDVKYTNQIINREVIVKMKKQHNFMLLPSILALGYVPLIVYMKSYDTRLSVFDWFPSGSESQVDFFLYYKMIAIVLLGVTMTILLSYKYLQSKQLKWEKSWFCLMGYAILALMSALFSQYKFYVFRGSYEVFESILVILSYTIFSFYTYQVVNKDSDVISLAKWASFGVLIMCVIGTLQFLGWDFFRSWLGKRMITPPSYWPHVNELSFNFPLKTSYTTLYNTNYLSFYFGLLIPILAALFIFEKNIKLKIAYGVFEVLAVVTMIGSNSKSGLLALIFALAWGGVLLFRKSKKSILTLVLAVVVVVITAAGYAIRLGGFDVLYHAIFKGNTENRVEFPIKDVLTTDSDVTFKINDDELHIAYDTSEDGTQFVLYTTDENGDSVEYTQLEDSSIQLSDERYLDCNILPIMIEDLLSIQVKIDGTTWYFCNQQDGTYYYYNAFNKFTKTRHVEKAHVVSDFIFSGRGELWNYIFPRLKHCIVLGTGANTFIMEYPQDNYIVKNYRGSQSLFDVKAHCMYLQNALENGVLALLCFLVFYIWYFVKSFLLYRKVSKFNFTSSMGMGIYLGSIAYMICGIANDSNVNTAPVFWILIGLGMAINRMITENKDVYMEAK